MPGNILKTYGLVACGGKSSRMGRDKSMLQYHEKQQRYHVYDMLTPLCDDVFISCNASQASTIEKDHHFITDDPALNDIGPMAALLTAFKAFPQKDLLFIGCDYPFLNATELAGFLDECDNTLAAFYNSEFEMYEPLLAFYPASSSEGLFRIFSAGQYSLQVFLNEQRAKKYFPKDKHVIVSIDTEEEYRAAIRSIKER